MDKLFSTTKIFTSSDEIVSEEEFLKQLFSRNNNAYKQLYLGMFNPMCRVAEYYTKNNDVARELVQDVFLALLESTKSFESVKHVKHFLYFSLKNKCTDYLRRQKIQNEYMRKACNTVVEPDFWDKTLEEDLFSILMDGLNLLPQQCKKVMTYTLEGKKNTEIAALMEISIETVKDYKRTSKIRLRKFFDKKISLFLFLIFGF